MSRAAAHLTGDPPASALTRATGRGAWFRERPVLATVLGAGLIIVFLLPFSTINPSPWFGLPGALAMAVALVVAVIVGPLPGAAVALAGGLFFYFAVADPDLPFRRDAAALTVLVWILLALAAGLVADRLRRRLVVAFNEIAKAQEQTAALHKRLERSLQPRVAVTDERLHVDHHYEPAEAPIRIGGDFMGTAELSDGRLALVIGDVSGHGLDAAALGATLRASWRALALTGMAPLELVQRLDGILRREVADGTVFATVCCAWVNPARNRLTLVLAGHHRPLLLVDGAASEPPAPFGPPLGLLEDWMRVADPPWQVADFALEPGWVLLLYTDGLVEGYAAPEARERFGVDRLAPLLYRQAPATCLDARALFHEVRAANGKPFDDDVALLVVCHAGADAGDS